MQAACSEQPRAKAYNYVLKFEAKDLTRCTRSRTTGPRQIVDETPVGATPTPFEKRSASTLAEQAWQGPRLSPMSGVEAVALVGDLPADAFSTELRRVERLRLDPP